MIQVHHIFVSPGHNYFGHTGQPPGEHPLVEVSEVECVAGRGLRGDRFFDYKADYKGQVTFFSKEVFEQVCGELAVQRLSPGVTRRNVVLSGVDLNQLIGSEFEIGQPKAMNNATNATETATFGGGCFWCTEAVFQMIPGVKSVTSGYAGGQKENPTYKEVCAGTTGHAEVIQMEFDPTTVSYEKLVDTFWEAHDPTTLNRQGADEGTQYRSIILYSSDAQREIAEKSKATAQKNFSNPIVTEIVPLTRFYKAEGYHQDYYNANPNAGYCRVVIRPKVEKMEKKLKAK